MIIRNMRVSHFISLFLVLLFSIFFGHPHWPGIWTRRERFRLALLKHTRATINPENGPMLSRSILAEFEELRRGSSRKPLILMGVRQVGKTTIGEMVASNYEQYINQNLERTNVLLQ